MLDQFKRFIADKNIFSPQDKILVAVSGGIDSMCLVHLLFHAGYDFAIAHCNFKLRGQASEEDALFVEEIAEELEVPFFIETFETQQLVDASGSNLQQLARELRYDWFEKVANEEGFDWIATAHHLDDAIETTLYNWTKGCGIKGMMSIPLVRNRIVRPLLFAGKDMILAYTKKHQIAFREDSSNLQDKYSRNKLRLNVIPELRKINPGLNKTAQKNFQVFEETAFWYQFGIDQLKKIIYSEKEDKVFIDLKTLLSYPFPRSPLYEWLSVLGFHRDQIDQLLNTSSVTGSLFFSKTHRLLKNRDSLVIEPLQEIKTPAEHSYIIEKGQQMCQMDQEALIFQNHLGLPHHFKSDKNIALLDSDSLKFPLKLRRWHPGDYFSPLGLEGKHQKLQDFFNNRKLDRFEKEKTWILEDKTGEICWVVGFQISDTFKLRKDTQHYVEIIYKTA